VTTPLGLKPGGFSGGLRFLMAPSKPKSFDVSSSVVIPVQSATTFTRMPTLIERFLANSSATTTYLAGIAWINFHYLYRTSLFRFVLAHGNKQ
jgi:hypothetical protein